MRVKTILISMMAVWLIGCSSEVSDSGYVYTPVTLKGSISGSSGGGSSLSIYNLNSDVTNYMVVIQNQVSNRIYISQVDGNGEFSFDENGSDSKFIEYINDSNGYGSHFMAMLLTKSPLRVVATAYIENGSSEGFSGLKITDNIESDLNFSVDEDNSRMSMTQESINAIGGITYDENFKVRLSDNKPVGADEFGKAFISESETTSGINKLDPDEDGRPNIFDGMNDGSQLDNLDAENKTEGATLEDSLESSIMFMNLKIDYEYKDSFEVTDNAVVVLEVVPRSTSSISSIKVADLSGTRLIHTNYQNSLIEKIPNGFTEIDTYPNEDTSWSASDYKLFKATNNEGNTVYTTLIKPNNNNFEPGDLILLEVNLSDGSKEYYFNSINFKFQTIPQNNTSFEGGDGSTGNPLLIQPTGDKEFSWDNPDDEDSGELLGLSYQFEIFYYENSCNNNQLGNMVVISDRESGVSGKNNVTNDEIDAQRPKSVCIQLDIAGSYPYGDNAALKYYIKRQDW